MRRALRAVSAPGVPHVRCTASRTFQRSAYEGSPRPIWERGRRVATTHSAVHTDVLLFNTTRCGCTRERKQTLSTQISTAHRTHARTGPDTQRAQAHNHTQNSNSRTHPRQTSRSQGRSHAHTHTSRTENDAHQQTTPPRITATLTQPPPRASALASGTIACAWTLTPADKCPRTGYTARIEGEAAPTPQAFTRTRRLCLRRPRPPGLRRCLSSLSDAGGRASGRSAISRAPS